MIFNNKIYNNQLIISLLKMNKKKQILEYRAPSSDLDKEFRFKEGNMTFRDRVMMDKETDLILNDLPTDKAFAIYRANR